MPRTNPEEDTAKYNGIADELGLEGDEREDFIGSAMKRLGYVARSVWNEPEPEAGEKSGDFFSSRRRESNKQREVTGNAGGNYANFRERSS